MVQPTRKRSCDSFGDRGPRCCNDSAVRRGHAAPHSGIPVEPLRFRPQSGFARQDGIHICAGVYGGDILEDERGRRHNLHNLDRVNSERLGDPPGLASGIERLSRRYVIIGIEELDGAFLGWSASGTIVNAPGIGQGLYPGWPNGQVMYKLYESINLTGERDDAHCCK